MRCIVFLISFFTSITVFAQNVTVDTNTYTAQELIEDILIDSNCITNVVVTNVIGGDFNNTDQSYGYFEVNGSTFPFQKGLVLSTGKGTNVEGPNNRLSDDDAPGWIGDADLETVLNESNTTNATVIEFDFTAISNQISFNYIFASEEYQESNSNTCKYSDLFGFLIRPKNEVDYTNIAVVPNTDTPVKVTTVHPAISGGCAAQNEAYFESWNGATAPINFNGQTKVLTAKATIIPNETYHVKLVIADEQNYRYDSAVFLQAGSFESNTDLGEDRLIDTKNPVCFNETLELDAFTSGSSNLYKWFKNNVELPLEKNSTYTVSEAGVYNVEVTLASGCISYGEITIEYAEDLDTGSNYLRLCDDDDDGLTFFDLHLADPFYADMTDLEVVNFFLLEGDAENNVNAIPNPSVFFNTVPNQVVFARIENEFGCYEVESLILDTSSTSINTKEFYACDVNSDGIAIFNLNELRTLIQPEVSSPANITFYSSHNDAAYHQNQLPDDYENTTANSQEIWVKAQDVFCELLTTVTLKVTNKPQLEVNSEQFYCLDIYPETIRLEAGVLDNALAASYTYEWFKNDVSLALNDDFIEVNEAGTYKVIVSHMTNCTSERTIIVNASEKAIIENVLVEETNNSNTATVITSGIGDYEFSLDNNSVFQQSNVFINVSSGNHTVYVKDVNGCGTIQENITIDGFPKFFTPNNDGFNDTWKPIGIDENFNAKIYIFDRYGKLLTQLNLFGNGWDGLVNGTIMPSSDYWYQVVYENGKTVKGHFTLKR